ncbi:hypothetical protein BH11MYX1_BH11MYX1_40620 [soil metagenome]
MKAVEPLRVHIAELVIATDPQAADVTIAASITKAAEAKGLAIVAREVVGDVEALIRAKLEQFIADPNIDVVVATGVAESAAASDALRPLITSPVPGFTDLFRWLAYQEIGASAMLSNAEAAQCASTFVFLLPAVKGAVEQAMEKLILPQLDPTTRPKNLIQLIPRLATMVLAAPLLPEPPVAEKAAIPQRIEAERTTSGPGIPARLPSNPAVPVQRPASKTGPHVIRKDDPDVTKQINRAELERNLVRSETNANDAVTKPSIDIRTLLPKVPPGADELDDTDMANVLAAPPPGFKPPTQRATRRPPTIQIPVRDAAAKELRTPPALTRKTPPRGAVVSLADLAKSAEALDPGAAPLPVTPVQPTRVAADADELDAAELEPATEAEFAKRTEDSQPAIIPNARPPSRRPATNPPPPPKKRMPTEPPPLFVSDKKQPPRPARTPTVPPKPRETFDDLPRGKFVYPTQKGLTGRQIATWAAFALLAAVLGIGFVHFFLTNDEQPRVAVVIADAPSAVPVDAIEVAVVEPDAAITEVEVEVDVGSAAQSHRQTNGGGRPRARVDAGVETGSASSSVASTGSNATAVAPEDPTCDEVSCVLEKYARSCCARYKPVETFKPGQTDVLDKVMVKQGIEGVKPRVIACGEKFAAKGTVKIAVSVAPAGGVKDTSVADAPDPELGKCVAQALRAATFAKTTKGGTFTYPFVF